MTTALYQQAVKFIACGAGECYYEYMDEKPSPPSLEELLRGIEPRVLLDLTFQIGAAPEQFRNLARLALSEGQVSSDVLIPLQAFVEHEQRLVPRKSRQELEGYVASVVIAHAWQNENTKARRHHKKIPH